MCRLIENPEWARELGIRWQERVVATWNWDVTCEKYLETVEATHNEE
jgi:glycosyltransferase involved in cell wall biosynthesis